MIFRNPTTRARISILILIPFAWFSCDGEAWAASCRAAETPALVSSATPRSDSPSSVLAPRARGTTGHAEQHAVVEMQGMAREIERFLDSKTADGARPAEPPRDLKARFETAHQSILQGFDATEGRIRAAGLPGKILERHEAARSAYATQAKAVLRDLESAERGKRPDTVRTAWRATAERLRRSTDERPRQELDLSRMPFRRADSVSRSPGDPLGPAEESFRAFSPTDADQLFQPPTPEDLAETVDVQLTEEIRALALELDHHPVEIFNWVHNKVELIPTHGSIQGAETTRVAQRGNAFDMASLLIALLRASNIPARYVTGTVEVSVDSLPGWLGVSDPGTAQQLLSQGGVPVVGVLRDGVVSHVRFDHAWVEAWVDYLPGRGAVPGEGNVWMPLDASFKVHEIEPPSDYSQDVPFDVLDLENLPFVVDETLGRITDLDDEELDRRLGEWAEESDTYFLTHDVEEDLQGILGGKAILQRVSTVLPSSLPYRVITRSAGLADLPSSLRHEVALEGFASTVDRAAGQASVSTAISMPRIGSSRLGIRFEPASEADAETLVLARDGGGDSLPVYLVEVVPVVDLDGVEITRGQPLGMGERFLIDVTLDGPEGPSVTSYAVLAGDEIVVGVTGNGVTPDMLEERLATHPVSDAPEYLHQVQLHYWMETDYLAEIAARSLGVHAVRRPSVGLFSSPLTVASFFGSPGTGVYQSRTMDVKQNVLGAAGDDPIRVKAFVQQAGLQSSYLEGGIFDQLEGREIPFIRGISAVHLLSSAMNQGIPIYRITAENGPDVLPRLKLDGLLMEEIRTALEQGKTVMVSERELDLGTWQGVGYIIQDEETGAAAYLISGGLAGGGLIECLQQLVPVFKEVLELAGIALVSLLLAVLILSATGGFAGALATFTVTGKLSPAVASFILFLLVAKGVTTTQLAGA